jgi:hypothetical protein
VADRMPDRVRSLIYVDGFVSENGKSVVDYGPDAGKRRRGLAALQGDGWKVPPLPASAFRGQRGGCRLGGSLEYDASAFYYCDPSATLGCL